MRRVSTAVLPEPAPATMSSGLPVWVTASSCCGLRPSVKASGDSDSGLAARGVPKPPKGIGVGAPPVDGEGLKGEFSFIVPSNLLAPPDTTRFRRASCYFLLRGRVAQYGLMTAEENNDIVDNGLDIRTPSGTDDPLSDAEIQQYREEINRMDRIILDAAKRRTEVSQAIGRTRMSSGGTRLVHTREIAILNQFRDELGEEGPTIASALLRMGRGRLG